MEDVREIGQKCCARPILKILAGTDSYSNERSKHLAAYSCFGRSGLFQIGCRWFRVRAASLKIHDASNLGISRRINLKAFGLGASFRHDGCRRASRRDNSPQQRHNTRARVDGSQLVGEEDGYELERNPKHLPS